MKIFSERKPFFRHFSGSSLVMRILVTPPPPQLGPAPTTSGLRRLTMAVQTSAKLTGNKNYRKLSQSYSQEICMYINNISLHIYHPLMFVPNKSKQVNNFVYFSRSNNSSPLLKQVVIQAVTESSMTHSPSVLTTQVDSDRWGLDNWTKHRNMKIRVKTKIVKPRPHTPKPQTIHSFQVDNKMENMG